MSHLFLSRNIEDGNARTGLPDTTREAVEAAAKQANAYDFIMSMPDGAISHRGPMLVWALPDYLVAAPVISWCRPCRRL